MSEGICVKENSLIRVDCAEWWYFLFYIFRITTNWFFELFVLLDVNYVSSYGNLYLMKYYRLGYRLCLLRNNSHNTGKSNL